MVCYHRLEQNSDKKLHWWRGTLEGLSGRRAEGTGHGHVFRTKTFERCQEKALLGSLDEVNEEFGKRR